MMWLDNEILWALKMQIITHVVVITVIALLTRKTYASQQILVNRRHEQELQRRPILIMIVFFWHTWLAHVFDGLSRNSLEC